MRLGKITVAVSLFAALLYFMMLPSAEASVLTYSNPAAFDAATTEQVTNGFSAGGAPYIPLGSPGSATAGDVTLTANGYAFIIGTGFYDGYGADFFSGQGSIPETITFSFSKPVDAFAFDFGSYDFANDPLTLTLSNGDTVNLRLPPTPGADEFIGLTSDSYITSASLTDSTDDVLDIIDVTTADATTVNNASVPEPGSLVLAGIGLIGLGALRRRSGKMPT
jgi:hypothetical protein